MTSSASSSTIVHSITDTLARLAAAEESSCSLWIDGKPHPIKVAKLDFNTVRYSAPSYGYIPSTIVGFPTISLTLDGVRVDLEAGAEAISAPCIYGGNGGIITVTGKSRGHSYRLVIQR